mgnify:CR=1 FL=1
MSSLKSNAYQVEATMDVDNNISDERNENMDVIEMRSDEDDDEEETDDYLTQIAE